MKTRPPIASLLLAGGLVWLLLLPPGGWAADDAARPQSKASFGEVIERQLPAPDFVVPNQVLLDLDTGKLLAMPTKVWMAGLGFNPISHGSVYWPKLDCDISSDCLLRGAKEARKFAERAWRKKAKLASD